ncbi:uncharacterized protein LOC130654109 [Hydractinia symbiolongicarpus]|uniref:uncharacterized protein LOC130654109 n=1 Tax=Hydractinia symbiolongicarpus TaxID=13093 RepID=UPI00254D932F|nr:uncharacterized protein LOC130654109 [Hydractinia symbiolongicarpus]
MAFNGAEIRSSQGGVEESDTGKIVLGLFLIIVCFSVPIVVIYIGARNVHNCPAQDLIPIYLIVSGAIAIIWFLTSIVCVSSLKALLEGNAFRKRLSCISPFFFGMVYSIYFPWLGLFAAMYGYFDNTSHPTTYRQRTIATKRRINSPFRQSF